MTFIIKDRVKETCTSPGTGTVTLLGASTGYSSFSTIGNANNTFYCIADQTGTNWEVGIGTYTSSGTTLSRDTVLANSLNTTTKINFASGTQDVFVTYPAEKSVNVGSGNNIQLDFSNATLLSRNSFQTSTVNGSTGIYALPNGTSQAASWQAANNADPTNASKILIATNGTTDVQLVSGINGTGTYLPLSFYTNGVQNAQLTTAGNFTVTGNVTGNSDERYKTNWRSVSTGFIYQLAGVLSGVYDRTDREMTQAGVSAQSLQRVLPEAVMQDGDGMLSVAYGNAALVACVELAKEVVKLHEELDAMKHQ